MQFSKRLDRFGEEIFAALNNRRMELEAQGMKEWDILEWHSAMREMLSFFRIHAIRYLQQEA